MRLTTLSGWHVDSAFNSAFTNNPVGVLIVANIQLTCDKDFSGQSTLSTEGSL
jgi:hypothetical protein